MRYGFMVILVLNIVAAVAVGCSPQQQQASAPASGTEMAAAVAKTDFDSQVAPILAQRCHECHGAQRPKARLSMLSQQSLLAGGASGTPVSAGNPDGSLIVQVIEGRHPDIKQMPPKGGPLAPEQIATIRAWISEM